MIGNFGKHYNVQPHVVKLDDGNTIATGYAAVTFPETYDNIPEVIVVRPLLADGTWGVTGVSVTGCTITVASEAVMGTAVEYKLEIASFERS